VTSEGAQTVRPPVESCIVCFDLQVKRYVLIYYECTTHCNKERTGVPYSAVPATNCRLYVTDYTVKKEDEQLIDTNMYTLQQLYLNLADCEE
jgi:hypothetical protein